MVGLGGGLHEIAFPGLSLRLAVGALDLPGLTLVAFVAHQHDGELHLVPFDLPDHLPDGAQLLQALAAGDGVHQDEGVALADGEALHGWELVRPRGVGDLQRTDVLVAADDLWRERERGSGQYRCEEVRRGSYGCGVTRGEMIREVWLEGWGQATAHCPGQPT